MHSTIVAVARFRTATGQVGGFEFAAPGCGGALGEDGKLLLCPVTVEYAGDLP